MANSSGVVGVLRALLTLDSAQFDTGMRKAVTTTDKTTTALGGLGKEVQKLTPQAERMVKALGGERLLASANNLTAAVTRVGGAQKLTEAQQKRVNATLTEAIAKYRALGQEAPKDMLAIANATKVASTSTTSFAASFGSVNRALGLFGVSLSVGAVVGFTKSLLDFGDEIVRVADQTGLTTEEVQRFQFIARQSGNSLDDITRATGFLQKSLGATGPELQRVKDGLKGLGIEFDQFRAAGPFEQLAQLADAFAKIEDPAARARAATVLFGRSGVEILPTLIANFRQLGNEAPVASDSIVRALDQAGDQLDKFGLQVKVWAAEAFNFLSTGIDRIIIKLLQFSAQFAELQAKAIEMAGKLPGVSKALGAFGITAQQSRDGAQFFTDQANAMQLQLERLEKPAQRASHGIQQFGDESADAAKKTRDAAQAARELRDAQEALRDDFNKTADAVEAAVQRAFDTDNLEDFRAQLRFIENDLNNAQDIADSINKNIGSLDEERMRRLLAANPPGSGIFKEAGGHIGTTMGAEMQAKLKDAFADIPHFLTSSVLHSGSFLNGLKALGVSMADAIVEPLLKQFAMKLAGARIASAISGGVGAAALGGGAAAAGTVAAEVGGTAAVTTAAVSGGAGGAAAAGGGFGGALSSFLTNPWTAVGAAAVVGGVLAFRHFRKGPRANDARDKDLAQFAGFDSEADKQDTANPPGFHGLARLLAKGKKTELFAPFVQARDPKAVRAAFAPIQAFMATLGRNVKSFNLGGFVPPGVVQPAILHGGSFGEVITPMQGPSSLAPVTHNYITVEGMLDSGNFAKLLRAYGFKVIGEGFLLNSDLMTTHARRALDR